MPQYVITVERDGPRAGVVLLFGEIDLSAAQAFRGDIELVLADDGIEVIRLALGGVTFMDCSGLGALLNLRALAEQRGKRLLLRDVSARVRRLFELAGLDHVLAVLEQD